MEKFVSLEHVHNGGLYGDLLSVLLEHLIKTETVVLFNQLYYDLILWNINSFIQFLSVDIFIQFGYENYKSRRHVLKTYNNNGRINFMRGWQK